MDDLTLSTGPWRQWNDCRVRRLIENLRGLWWAHQDLNLEPTDSATSTENQWLQRFPGSTDRQNEANLGMVVTKVVTKKSLKEWRRAFSPSIRQAGV
jgi:hypothetical protein